jgi:hypothetical protein
MGIFVWWTIKIWDSNPSKCKAPGEPCPPGRVPAAHLFSFPQGKKMQIESYIVHQKRSNFCLPKVTSFFIQAAGLAYHRRTKCGAYHQGRQADLVSHHASACISLRLDEIQHFVLMIYRNRLRMICNSYGIDDIQGFALTCLRKSSIILLEGVVLSVI